jgi:hypothetical protein
MAQRLAIVERLPGHSEVMGGFAALAIELGYDTHLLFNGKDPFHVVEYLRTRLPIASENIHDWSYINDPGANFDVILLNTSYVWLDYGRPLQEWNANKRLIVVHHHPEDIELNPHGARVYLTPAAGKEKWIFPLYSRPQSAGEPGLTDDSLLSVRDSAELPTEELPTLVTIGALDLKNVADVFAYMKAGGKIVHYDRHQCRHFEDHDGSYTQHVGLNGTDFMASLGQQKQPMFLWFPILPDSNYMECRFCGALILGVEFNCVMVMPERLRRLYEFPEEAVITYDSSVTEAGCVEKLRASALRQEERRRQLRMWAVERWQKNMDVFRSLVERG